MNKYKSYLDTLMPLLGATIAKYSQPKASLSRLTHTQVLEYSIQVSLDCLRRQISHKDSERRLGGDLLGPMVMTTPPTMVPCMAPVPVRVEVTAIWLTTSTVVPTQKMRAAVTRGKMTASVFNVKCSQICNGSKEHSTQQRTGMTTDWEGDFKAACGRMMKKATLSKADKLDSIIWYRWISKSCSVSTKLACHTPC